MTRESDIKHENGAFWVCREKAAFTVYKIGATHSTSVCSFADLSLAVAYCDYLAKKGA